MSKKDRKQQMSDEREGAYRHDTESAKPAGPIASHGFNNLNACNQNNKEMHSTNSERKSLDNIINCKLEGHQ